MLKKMFALILAFISFSTFANTKQEFNNLINEFSYNLIVEWDQKDQAYLDGKMTEFKIRFEDLRKSGLRTNAINEVLKEKSLRPQTSQEIEHLVSQGRLQSNEEILNYIHQNPKSFMMTGASWNGEAVVKIFWVTGILLVTTAVILLLNSRSDDSDTGDTCSEYSSTPICAIPKECIAYDDMKNCIAWKEAVCDFVCLSYR